MEGEVARTLVAPEQLHGMDEARVQRRRPPHPWRARAPLRRRPREPERRGLGGPRPGGVAHDGDRVVAMRVVVVVRVALQEGERLRGVVHGDATDGPHGGQVPAEAAAALREDGLGVVQEREAGQVGVRARRHLMMVVVLRAGRRVVVSRGCRRRRGGEGEGGGRGGRRGCSRRRRRRRRCSRRRGGV